MTEALRFATTVERVLVANEAAASAAVGAIRRAAEEASVPVRAVPRTQVDRLAEGGNHQGVVAVVAPYRYAVYEDLLRAPDPALVVLDGVMDPHNLGSLLRSADGAGFDGVVIRSRRAAQVTAAARRAASGAAEVVPVARVVNVGRAIDQARAAGLWVVGLDGEAPGDLWGSDLLARPVALVLGSEDRGMSRVVRERCDEVRRIPSRGKIGSLNVAVAGAIAMFEVLRRDRGRLP